MFQYPISPVKHSLCTAKYWYEAFKAEYQYASTGTKISVVAVLQVPIPD
jgi:hypothetical protein